MTEVVVFNGPPGSGKDHCAGYLQDYLSDGDSSIVHFKRPLYDIVAAIYGVSISQVYARHSRDLKEIPWSVYGGKSSREVFIEVSEEVIKPYYGAKFFGDKAVDRIRTLYQMPIFLFGDSGFEEELEPVSRYVGRGNVILCRIKGRGSFENDSRSFLSGQHAGIVLDYDNSGSLDDLHEWVESIGEILLEDLE